MVILGLMLTTLCSLGRCARDPAGPAHGPAGRLEHWDCSSCTFHNQIPEGFPATCDLCGHPRDGAANNGNQSNPFNDIPDTVLANIGSFAVHKQDRGRIASVSQQFCRAFSTMGSLFNNNKPRAEVTGAADDRFNGWYYRQSTQEGAPLAALDFERGLESWIRYWTQNGVNWYFEKDDGSAAIYWSAGWEIQLRHEGFDRAGTYEGPVDPRIKARLRRTGLDFWDVTRPPAAGWQFSAWNNALQCTAVGRTPAPDLRLTLVGDYDGPPLTTTRPSATVAGLESQAPQNRVD